MELKKNEVVVFVYKSGYAGAGTHYHHDIDETEHLMQVNCCQQLSVRLWNLRVAISQRDRSESRFSIKGIQMYFKYSFLECSQPDFLDM